MRNVAASTLHDDAPCVDGISLEISSLSHADGVVIANRKKVVAWAEVSEIDRTAVCMLAYTFKAESLKCL